MEDQTQPTPPTAVQPNRGQFMDVQRPRTNTATVAPEAVPSRPQNIFVSSEPELAYEAPAPTVPKTFEPTSEENNVQPTTTPAPSSTQDQAPNPMAIPELPANTRKKSAAPIFIAVLLALVMAGVSVYAFMQSKDATKVAPTAQPSQAETNQAAAETELTTASQELDQALQASDENADFPDEQLSDQALGL